VFFPAYNDAGTIASMVVTARRAARELTDDFEIVVVNDGSRDHTAEVLAELESVFPELRVIHHSVNRGYGGALRTGFASASKELVFYTDGDAQYDPSGDENFSSRRGTTAWISSTATRSDVLIRSTESSLDVCITGRCA